ncbi:hypothetical protein PRIPAC_70213 [Pristionchus pacificus]|uniref:Uncharacterized protein n=1 Tax=Pristionchus pacificus TaxID=54126 RepID=A0A2A6C599_PRIPA|nr:hypothetical protein PRIPAC_70213 [Pristionchus pacificus]|eukprot:PDM73287.1 hypothetical protein PRIPAC_40643 [Pristionchus pacificus]
MCQWPDARDALHTPEIALFEHGLRASERLLRTMGLEMLSLHKTVMEKYGQTHSLQQTDKRLMIGAGVLVAYMFIGAVVFVHLESPLEEIERGVYASYIQEWRGILRQRGLEGKNVVEERGEMFKERAA